MTGPTRIERDTMGEIDVPADAYWGAATERARRNFTVGGGPIPRSLIRALGLLKAAFARAGVERGVLDASRGDAIARAADEVARGELDAQFVVDVFQTGSGTSSNMNANEVIANRAAELLGAGRGAAVVHPNDDVNRGQSSNDVFPSAVQIALGLCVGERLLPAMEALGASLHRLADRTFDVVTIGRTHLMDALPIRLGQRVRGYAQQVERGMQRIGVALDGLLEVPLGGTAVGTGVNAEPIVVADVLARIGREVGWPRLRATTAPFQAQSCVDAVVAQSGAVRTFASGLFKIANDVRWMGSGPLAGLAEVSIPAVQPGSSIMPAKVNPVICESVLMVCTQVLGNDQVIAIANSQGQFELNTMLPLMARASIESVSLLAGACEMFRLRCVDGLAALPVDDRVARNPMLVTALNEAIGYERAAAIAKVAVGSGRSVRDVAREMTGLSVERLDELLDPRRLAGERGRRRET